MVEIFEWDGPGLHGMANIVLPLSCCFIIFVCKCVVFFFCHQLYQFHLSASLPCWA
jgi:hypothetical protein